MLSQKAQTAPVATLADAASDDDALLATGVRFRDLSRSYFHLKNQHGGEVWNTKEGRGIEAELDDLADQIDQQSPQSLRTMAVRVLSAVWSTGRDAPFDGTQENDIRFVSLVSLTEEAMRLVSTNRAA